MSNAESIARLVRVAMRGPCLLLGAALIAAPVAHGTPAEGNWTMPAKDYASTRYSGLAQINAHNAKGLHPLWTFSTGVLGGHEGQPLVVNDTMYVVTPWPNTLYAFDLTQEGYPLKWKYRPDVSPNAIGIACCDSVNRGAFYADGKIVYNLLDGHTVAVDAASGQELWNTQIASLREGETTTMAPFVAKNVVIVGASGGEMGIHGWIKGLDLKTGKVLWTAHNMGPDEQVLAKAGTFHPFYDQGSDLARTSWPKDTWKTGGGPIWGWISYDPELDLIYYGTGNPSPYNPEQREGDNKWTCSVLARRPSDGALVWAYQFTPHDNWDYDAVAAMVLADVKVGGRTRKAIVTLQQEWFSVHARSRHRRGAWRARLRARHVGQGGRLEDRAPDSRRQSANRGLQREGERHLSESRGRRESGIASGLLAAHAALLYLDQQSLHGLHRQRLAASQGDAVHRRRFALQSRTRRQPRQFPGLGRREWTQGVGNQGALPGLERRAGDGG